MTLFLAGVRANPPGTVQEVELIAGLGASVVGATAAEVVRSLGLFGFRVEWRWLRLGWKPLVRVVPEFLLVLTALVRGSQGTFRELDFPGGESVPPMQAVARSRPSPPRWRRIVWSSTAPQSRGRHCTGSGRRRPGCVVPPAWRELSVGALSVVAALGLAWLGPYWRRLPKRAVAVARRAAGGTLRRLELLHDGVVGEYVTWLTVGAATVGALFAVLIR